MRKTILAMALLASMTAMAQENAKVDVHARYTKVVTPVDGKYESKRPPVEDRLFTSTAVEKKIKEVQKLLKKNPKLAWMFANCYPNTLESTVHYQVVVVNMLTYNLAAVNLLTRVDEELTTILQLIDGVSKGSTGFERNHATVRTAADFTLVWLILLEAVSHDSLIIQFVVITEIEYNPLFLR